MIKNLDLALQKLQKEFVLIAVFNPGNYSQSNTEFFKTLIEKKHLVPIYVTINKPYLSLVSSLEQTKIETKKIFFVDMITKTANRNPAKESNVMFLESPRNLTDLGIALNQVTQSIDVKNRLVYFDSLSALLIHNDSARISKFFHFLITKLRVWGLSGVIIALDKKEDKEIIAQISQFCDNVLEVDK